MISIVHVILGNTDLSLLIFSTCKISCLTIFLLFGTIFFPSINLNCYIAWYSNAFWITCYFPFSLIFFHDVLIIYIWSYQVKGYLEEFMYSSFSYKFGISQWDQGGWGNELWPQEMARLSLAISWRDHFLKAHKKLTKGYVLYNYRSLL